MRQIWQIWAVAIVMAIAPRSATAQTLSLQDCLTDSPIQTANPVLQASLERITRGSALWRAGVEAVCHTGRHAIVVSSDNVVVSENRDGHDRGLTDGATLGEVLPVLSGNSDVPLVLVVVNLRLIQAAHDALRSLPREFEMDLDRILIHEIYGHAIPYLLAGNLSGRCADPKQGERASDACSILRENAVRAELGLGRRTDYGLSGLTLTWLRSF